MIYSAIGVMSGSSLDGLDIVHAAFLETGSNWNFEIKSAGCYDFTNEMRISLENAAHLSAYEYQLLHVEFGRFIGQKINDFIAENLLEHKIHLISSHGHTVFHSPDKKMTSQLGNGATIAAETKLPVVCDLRNMDIALGGQGAPIVPIGEKLLFPNYGAFLNIGGIANVSIKNGDEYIAFDICAANRVLNMLTNEINLPFDDEGKIAAKGNVNEKLFSTLNELDFYKIPYPKSLSNSFGIEVVFPLIKSAGLSVEDALRTYVEHISQQVFNAVKNSKPAIQYSKMLVTGGGAFNLFLIKILTQQLAQISVQVVVGDNESVMYKEALIMALIGVLRWREETNVLSSVTGAVRSSVGGALWLGS